MFEKYTDRIVELLLEETPVMLVALLWTYLAAVTNQSYIGLAGLAILYRHYVKKESAKKGDVEE